nr:substrate-binding domain-containing protein [Streptomyces monashensis]
MARGPASGADVSDPSPGPRDTDAARRARGVPGERPRAGCPARHRRLGDRCPRRHGTSAGARPYHGPAHRGPARLDLHRTARGQPARLRDATAVFAAGGQVALGALRAFHETGRTVPDELGVRRGGLRRHPRGAHFLPPLTTVRADVAGIGTRSPRLLLDGIDRRTTPPTAPTVSVELVGRRGTDPAADAGQLPSWHR